MENSATVRVLFVCLGNICRSPSAHGVFEALVEQRGLAGRIVVDSCGTGHWHVGEAPDERAIAAARTRGYRLEHLRARQLSPGDFDAFDYILAMDRINLREIHRLCPARYPGHIGLFLDFAAGYGESEVPDPYYGGVDGFAHVLDLVEAASHGLLSVIQDANPA